MKTLFLSLGTNLGRLNDNIDRACFLIQERVGVIEARSADFISEPWGFQSDNLFLNIALRVRTNLLPMEVLRVTQQIERDMGRTEKSVNGVYHDRIIDIDLLEYEGVTMQSPELTLPHPFINQRDFVRIPLAEIK